ncbi:MAG: phosphatase PAP2 family protein [Planctomycetaceae bacterium]|nr:MAG: phosphatase PAP2 family protein [Planctomycetaceae bacterium]
MTSNAPPRDDSAALPLPLMNRTLSLDLRQRPGLLLWSVVFAAFSVPLATLMDIRIAQWFDRDPLPGDFVRTMELIRFYAHGSGIFFILLSVFLMAPQVRSLLPRLVAMVAGASAVSTVAKMFVLRLRPSQINLDLATVETAWWWHFDWSLEHVAMFDASARSFPSGNMASAVALTIGLCAAVPRGRWLFVLFCGLTVMQRMQSGTHFFSDVVGGIAAGLLWSYICIHPKLLGLLFDKMELPETKTSVPKTMAPEPVALPDGKAATAGSKRKVA